MKSRFVGGGRLVFAARSLGLSLGILVATSATGNDLYNTKCGICHSDQPGINGLGPTLYNVVNRAAASVPGFGYSMAMQGSGLTWTEANLDAFLTNPDAKVPQNSMGSSFAVASASDRAALIAYLKTRTAPSGGPYGTGKLQFRKGAPCYYRNPLFGRDVRAIYSLVDTSTNPPTVLPDQGPFVIDGTGIYSADGRDYGITPPTPGPNLAVQVECGAETSLIPLDPATGLDPNANIRLKNAAPVVTDVWAELKGERVSGVAPGTKVTLRATTTDANKKDDRVVKWRVTDGRLSDNKGDTVIWKLPNSGGVHVAYVLANDRRGGYDEDAVTITTDAGTIAAKDQEKAAKLPSDKIQAHDHFLTWYSTRDLVTYRGPGADSARGACQYYVDIGYAKSCSASGKMKKPINFEAWKKRWQFKPDKETHAVYANKTDLNLQRDMHAMKLKKPKALRGYAFYVCNHPNPGGDSKLSTVLSGKKLIACVAMEYSVTPGVNNDTAFVKFLTFGPSGQLFTSVNLDGEGEKFMPGSCVVCHAADPNSDFVLNSGGRYPESPANPNLGGRFLPFDLDNYKFPKTKLYRRSKQEGPLRRLNRYVNQIDDKMGNYSTVRELIDGWYAGGDTFDGSFVPPGWNGNADQAHLYTTVVKPSCRTCHVALSQSFETYADFAALAPKIASLVCGNRKVNGGGFADETLYRMPNSLVTFNRFWTDEDQPKELLKFLKDQGLTTATCDPPS